MIIKDCATNAIIKVHQVEIYGDSLGWDLWYLDEDGNQYHDISVEVIKPNKRVKKFIKKLNKLYDPGLRYKFTLLFNV